MDTNISELIVAYGPTWLNINVNQLSNKDQFLNFQKGQHGWMNPNGRWITHGRNKEKKYFCVESNSSGYSNCTTTQTGKYKK